MKIKPLSDRVVLKWLKKENITKSGILLPDSANPEKPYIYEVVAVWPGKKDTEMNVKVWDKVLCGQYAGDEVKVEDEEYKIVAIEYLLAVVE